MRLGAGIAQIFQQPLREVVQINRYGPAVVAAMFFANTPVLLTCSNADGNVPGRQPVSACVLIAPGSP